MIRIEKAKKKYGDYSAVDGLSLSISRGTIFGFLGANGAGKTTTLKMLAGLSIPTEGEIWIGGGKPEEIATREKIGFLPETPSFYEYLTGKEFLTLCAELTLKKSSREFLQKKISETLEDVGIRDASDVPVRAYSKGMRTRLGFAATIVHDPEYVFLDEPLDGLDPLGRKMLKEFILNLKDRGKTIFFSTHILFDIEELCDIIGIIHRGKLLYSGSIQEFCGGKPLEEKFVETIEKQ